MRPLPLIPAQAGTQDFLTTNPHEKHEKAAAAFVLFVFFVVDLLFFPGSRREARGGR